METTKFEQNWNSLKNFLQLSSKINDKIHIRKILEVIDMLENNDNEGIGKEQDTLTEKINFHKYIDEIEEKERQRIKKQWEEKMKECSVEVQKELEFSFSDLFRKWGIQI